jgi:translocator protein
MTVNKNVSSFWKLTISVIICETIGIASGLLTQSEMNTWFTTLNKPSWNPPSYLFAPVWTTLYLLMGIALWLIWKSDALEQSKIKAIIIFAIQLFFNFWWSILFFKFHSPALALFDIVLMIITILISIFHFAPISKLAAWLLIPYLFWVCFATVLNYSIWMLNR